MFREGKRRIRAKFSQEEDEHLKVLVLKYGDNNWDQVVSEMPGRNVRQCRERWKHYLSCEKPSDAWTQAEDDLIVTQVQKLGGKWTKIAAMLPGRTDLQTKNRWSQIFRRQDRQCPRTVRDKRAAAEVPEVPDTSESQKDLFDQHFSIDDEDNQGMGVPSETQEPDWHFYTVW